MTEVAAGPSPRTDVDLLCINTVRTLAMDAVQQADSGHPGTPMALAPLAYVLWTRHLRFDPAHPDWPDRDRFVLSCGHACMLQYAALFLSGYDLTLDDIKKFRQWGSKTPGHPEYGHTPGVEATTGPLGQGTGNAVGMAIAEAVLASLFNRPGHDVVNHFTYFVASDGDLMEGISHEACSLAGHLKLGKLIGIYDDNRITIEGNTDLTFSDDTARRFESYGWHVQKVADVNDLAALDAALGAAKQAADRPSLIIVRSHIGYGAPHKQDTAEAHGAALGVEEVKLAKANLGWPWTDPFHVPEEALAHWRGKAARGREARKAWEQALAAYRKAFPELARELERRQAGRLPAGWEQAIPDLAGEAAATRASSGKVLNAIAPRIPELVGGSADLAGSNNTLIKGTGDFAAGRYTERNFHFGIREHGMGAVMNGLALHRGCIPYGGTFLIFSDYMRPAIRLAALCKLGVIYLFTHDSIGLGEDGPTHQPIEQLAALRAIPGLLVIRPADGAEVAEAWRLGVAHREGPVALVLTRQKVSGVDRKTNAPAAGLARGGYVLADASSGTPKVILIATGSEVELALAARQKLEASGTPTRVVSMPCVGLFLAQPASYREQVLLPAVRARVSIEAGATQGWHAIVGDRGRSLGLDHFGASAPYQKLYQEFGLTVDRIVAAATQVIADV